MSHPQHLHHPIIFSSAKGQSNKHCYFGRWAVECGAWKSSPQLSLGHCIGICLATFYGFFEDEHIPRVIRLHELRKGQIFLIVELSTSGGFWEAMSDPYDIEGRLAITVKRWIPVD